MTGARGAARRTGASLLGLGCVLAILLTGCQQGDPGRVEVPGASTGSSAAPTTDPQDTAQPTADTSPGGSSPDGDASSAGTPSSTASHPPGERSRCVDELDLADQVGQLFMVAGRSDSAAGMSTLLRTTRAGSVILMGNSAAGVQGTRTVTDQIRAAAAGPAGVGLLIATDQEGGEVQRLSGPGFSRWPAPITQATWSDADLQRRASGWGAALSQAGVDVALAPVADVVPTSLGRANEPVGRYGRGYGSDPSVVAAKVSAFVAGMDSAGTGTSVKHFPGLGKVRGNTDFAADVIDTSTTRDDPDLAAFDAAIGAGADMVMVSTAQYARIDPGHPAAFSRVIIDGMLRGDRSYDKVVISDDLGVAKQVADRAPGDRALSFLRAGGDLVVNVDPGSAEAMITAVLDAARADPDLAADIAVKAERVLQMKHRRGLADCD